MNGESFRLARGLALATPLFLLGGAYVAQYGFGLPPCEMCWWQRYPQFAALALAALAFVAPGRTPQRLLVMLAAIAIAVSGLIGAFHAGVEYGWWQGLTACSSTTLASGGDPLASIWATPIVRCDVAPWSLMGVSLAGWNFLFSTAAALCILLLLRRRGRA